MIVNENLAIQVGLVQTKDFGSYTCIASNQWGKTRHQVIILYIFLNEPPWYCNGKLLVIINHQVLLGPPSRPNPPSRVQVCLHIFVKNPCHVTNVITISMTMAIMIILD